MGKITFSGTLPQEITNGLAVHSKDFIENPLTLVPVVGFITVQKITQKPETGESYPTIRFQHLEVVAARDIPAHAKMIARALGDRTGAQELPFQAGNELPLKDQFPDSDDFQEPDGDGEGHEE